MPSKSQHVSSLDELGDRDAPMGSRPWAIYFLRYAKDMRSRLDHDAKMLGGSLRKLESGEAWKALGVLSFDALCTTELELTAEQVEAVKSARPGQTVGAVLHGHGGDRKSEEFQANNISLKQHGTSKPYLETRLREQHPDIYARYQAGEHKSIRQAAIAAGIVKVKSPLEKAKDAVQRLDKADWKAFGKWWEEEA